MADNPSPVEVDDEEIVLLMMDRDEEGLRRLLRAYGPLVIGILRKDRYQDILDHEDYEAALYVGADSAFRKAHTFDPAKGSLSTWFLNITRNALIDIYRREKKHLHVSLSYDPEDEEDDLYNETQEVDPKSPKGRLFQALQNVIERLPPQPRAVMKADLAANGKAEAAPLAAHLGTSVNTIYVQRSRGREAIASDKNVLQCLANLRKTKS